MTQSLSDLSDQILAAARRAGADAADAIAVDGTSLSITVREGALEQAERSEGIDIGLRVFVGQRQACVSSSDTKARYVDPDGRARRRDGERGARRPAMRALPTRLNLQPILQTEALELFDPSEEPDPAALQEDATRAEAAALRNAGISQVQSASAGYGRRRIHLAASNGFSAGYARSDRGLSCVAISGTGAGMERDYDYDSRVFQADLRDAEEIGRIAAERAVERIGAKKPKTGAYPVLFDERVASALIGSLLQATNGMMIARGSSWLRDAMGEQVLPNGLSVIEDPHRVARHRLAPV